MKTWHVKLGLLWADGTWTTADPIEVQDSDDLEEGLLFEYACDNWRMQAKQIQNETKVHIPHPDHFGLIEWELVDDDDLEDEGEETPAIDDAASNG